MSQSNSSNIQNAEQLYDKAKALSQHARPLDQRIAGIIIESANDAIKEFGNTNQEKKIELKKMIAEAEDVLPPATIEELRKRAEGKALKKVHPKNKTLRNVIYAVVALIIVVSGLFAFRKLFSGQTEVTGVDSSPTPHTTPTPQNQVENLAHDIDQGRKQLPVTPGANIPKEKPNYRRIRTKNGFTASCLNPPVRATLDYWPITYGDDAELCHIPPIVDARLSNGKYSRSKEDWERGITAHAGDEIYVVIYLNNGAADNLGQYDPSIAVAKNVSVKTETDTLAGSVHRIKVTATGDNVETVYGEIKITTNANERIEVLPNSGEIYDFQGEHPLYSAFNIGNNIINIGDLRPYFEDSMSVRYKLKILPT